MKKKDRLPPFTPTSNKLIDSDVYKKLTNAAKVAYLLLCRQRRRFDQSEVCFPYSHAQEYMDRHTWGRAVRELIGTGMVGMRQEGGLYRRKDIYTIPGDSIRGVEMHTVRLGEILQTSAQNHTVRFMKQ
jgi:hypothetical protein